MSGIQRVGGVGRQRGTSAGHEPPNGRLTVTRMRWVLGPVAFPLVIASVVAVAVVAVCVATGASYHWAIYDSAGRFANFVAVGMLVSFLYTLPFVYRSEFGIDRFLTHRARLGRLALNWTWAFITLGVVAFLTKSTATFSRGWVLLFYLAGGATILALEVLFRWAVRSALSAGRIARRRVMLIGTPDEIEKFSLSHAAMNSTIEIASVAAVPHAAITGTDPGTKDLLQDILDRAAVSARAHEIECVVLLSDWSQIGFVDASAAAFSMLPVSIYIDAGRLAQRFKGLRLETVGPIAALALTEPPLGPFEALAKRVFDIVVALAALIALGGVFAIVALLIKRDSPGPVFFRQRRLGYNQREFRIFKFRSMTSADDGDRVPQVKVGDPRITRIGAILRRFNIDELPQLINVLKGEMSIVGPRPHAIAHDRLFEKRIGMYPRRLNVLPGITGWAQVNGFRGETDTDEKMAARVAHDLYYIDNWSPWLDLYIVTMTLVSAKAYRNAV
jgi:polysaccharide biosynthesis protein PslA